MLERCHGYLAEISGMILISAELYLYFKKRDYSLALSRRGEVRSMNPPQCAAALANSLSIF